MEPHILAWTLINVPGLTVEILLCHCSLPGIEECRGLEVTCRAEVVLVRVLELGLVQQLVQRDHLLVRQVPRRSVPGHASPHLRYQPPCAHADFSMAVLYPKLVASQARMCSQS